MVNVLPQIIHLKRVALDLFFPQWCISCGREGDYICESCRKLLPAITPPVCPRCGRPQSEGVVCHDCRDGEPLEIEGIRSPFIFDGVIRRAIHELKYHNLRALVPRLAGLLHDYLVKNPIAGDVLVPVPIHPKRQQDRGYNQSALIVRELGRLSGLPAVTDCLVRRKNAPPQARSGNVSERFKNVADAFICPDEQMRDRQVIVTDDVATSGATLNACARALKVAGARTVWGLTLAREL
jgi:ComF family protein